MAPATRQSVHGRAYTQFAMDTPNLDALDEQDLAAFCDIALRLVDYAGKKQQAMALRAAGLLAEATRYEALCETIYTRLPAGVQW